jgi:hypothetical protein
MTRYAAETLVAEREGRLCVRFYRRADGTVITRDCENAWRRAGKRVSHFVATATTLAIAAMLSPLAGLARTSKGSPVENCEVPRVVERPIAMMGDVAPAIVQGGCPAPPAHPVQPAPPAPPPVPPPAPPVIMGKIAAPAIPSPTRPATQPSP